MTATVEHGFKQLISVTFGKIALAGVPNGIRPDIFWIKLNFSKCRGNKA